MSVLNRMLIGMVSLSLLNSCNSSSDEKQVSVEKLEIANQAGEVGLTVLNDSVYFKNDYLGFIEKANTVKNSKGQIIATWKDDTLSDLHNRPIARVDDSGHISTRFGIKMFWSDKGLLTEEHNETGEEPGFSINPVDEKLFKYASIIILIRMAAWRE